VAQLDKRTETSVRQKRVVGEEDDGDSDAELDETDETDEADGLVRETERTIQALCRTHAEASGRIG
jgi:hypothetical protein